MRGGPKARIRPRRVSTVPRRPGQLPLAATVPPRGHNDAPHPAARPAPCNRRSDGFLESMRGVVVGVPRFYYAVYNAGRVAADYKLLPRVADWQGVDEDSEEYSEREARVHQRAADRILSMSLSMGGLWVKLAQYVSTLKPMVPEQFTSTLAAAQDSATGRDYEEIAQVIEQELGARPEELFAYFEKKPVAAASIAQVHRAVTLDGERVAIKVQYPSLPRQMAADIAALRVSPLSSPLRWRSRARASFACPRPSRKPHAPPLPPADDLR